MDLDDLFAMATHLQCAMCQHQFPNDGQHDVGFKVESEEDLEDVYDEVSCCDDPLYDAHITSDKPLFPPEDPESDVNLDAYVANNPRLGIYGDQWHYRVGEDLLEQIGEGP